MSPWAIGALVLCAAVKCTFAQEFYLAADFSYEPMESCYGKCSPYKASAGTPAQDAFLVLKSFGVNTVRLRLWNNPSHRAGDGDETYANVSSVLGVAKRVAAAGLQIWLDFHYGDTWCDPGKQAKPAAWAQLGAAALAAAVGNFTATTLQAFVAQGTAPAVVQVGNEITGGMLWSSAGQDCSDGGRLGDGCDNNWPALIALLGAGIKAVRRVVPTAKVMLHTDLGNRLGQGQAGVSYITGWYSSYAATPGAVDYDLLGLSYYPKWGAGDTDSVLLLSSVKTAFPGKGIVLAETAYPWGGSAAPGSEFPWSPAGQASFISTLLSKSRTVGIQGVAWWGGEEFDQDTGAGQTALFDRSAVALPALSQGWK